MTTVNTKVLSANLRKDAVVSALIPPTLCQSQPVPLLINGGPCLGYYFYGIVGRTDQHSLLTIPLYRVVISKQTGRVIEAVSGLSFLPPNANFKKPAARFPGKGLAGKTIEEQNVLFNKYYELCDKLLDSSNGQPFDQSPIYSEWQAAFETVMEEGLEQWYKNFPGFNQKPRIKENANQPQQDEQVSKPQPDDGCKGSMEPSRSQQSVSNPAPPAIPQSSHSVPKIKLPIQEYLSRIEELVNLSKCSNLKKQLDTVLQMRVRNDFKIAVIGEFSRGKSCFLNKLLDTDLLTEGVLPTTAIITQIENGPSQELKFIAPGKEPQKLDVSADSFEKFIADDHGNDPSGVLILRLPIDWFNGHNIRLYDTPGAGDIFGKRAELTLESIQLCDAVIMAIAAPMACSMTEMAFLHDNVVLKATPKVSILITKLDTVSQGERQSVVEYIQEKIRSEVADAKFWTVMTPPDLADQTAKLFDAAGVPAIRKAITDIVTDEDLLRLRSIQAVTMLKDIAVQIQQSVKIQLNTLNETKEQKLAKLQEIKRQQDDKTVLWDRLKLEIDNSRMETSDSMEVNLNKSQDKLYDELAFQLDKSRSPNEWLEKDFQFSLRRSIENITTVLEKEILQKFALCQQTLIKQTNQQFGVSVESVDFANFMLGDKKDVYSSDGNPELTDLGRYQQITRVALIGATPLAYLTLGPFGALVTAGTSWFAGEAIKKQVEEQKQQVKNWLHSSLDQVFDQLKDILDNYIKDGYDKILNQTQSAAQKWLDNQQNAYEQACNNVNNDIKPEPLENLIAQSTQIINEINIYLKPKH